jgi:hypothetical protein
MAQKKSELYGSLWSGCDELEAMRNKRAERFLSGYLRRSSEMAVF